MIYKTYPGYWYQIFLLQIIYTIFYIRTSKAWLEAQLFLISTLTPTLLKGVGKLFFVLLKMITNDIATISRKHFWKLSVSEGDSRNCWSKIEDRCSRQLMEIFQKHCLIINRSWVRCDRFLLKKVTTPPPLLPRTQLALTLRTIEPQG